MQDLFQLGIPADDPGATPAAGRTARSAHGSRRAGQQDDVPSFDAVLALAAALAAAPPAPTRDQPLSVAIDAQQRISDVVGPRTEVDTEATPFSLPSQARWSGAFGASDAASLADTAGGPESAVESASRNLFQHFAGSPGATEQRLQTFGGSQLEADKNLSVRPFATDAAQGTNPATASNGLAAPDVAGPRPEVSDPAVAPTDIPLDYRPVTRRVPVSTEQRPEPKATSVDAAPSDAIIDGMRRRWRDESRPTIINDYRRLPRFATPIDDGGLTVPDLRVVARNDNPTPAPIRDLAPPLLRLIDFEAAAAPRPSDDLAARLAGSWEQSFVAGGADTLNAAPVIGLAPPAMLRERGSAGHAVVGDRDVDFDASEAVDSDQPAPEPVDFTDYLDVVDEPRPEPRDTGDEFVPPATSHAPETTSNQSTVTPVPLFDELLAVKSSGGASFDGEPIVSVRQAAMEIANEVRHLQRTGGSELAFSLRLHPEHLGQVEIAIQRIDDVWSISIIAANDEARDALTAEISRLEHRFRENNFTLDGVSVVTKAPEEAISAPTAGERSSGADFRGGDQQGLGGDENRDQSGWRNNGPAGILSFDSRADVEIAQELTSRHGTASDAGIDIKA